MKTCNCCGQSKANEHYRKVGRGLSNTCKACDGREDGESRLAAIERPLPPVQITATLEIPSGLGVRASAEDGLLHLEQDRPNPDDGVLYTHNISLSLVEARSIVDWIAGHIPGAQA